VVALLASYASGYISPDFFWPPAFFGFLYPIFLLMNLGFTIFWIVLWKRIALLSAVVLIVGIMYPGRFLQIDLSGPLDNEEPIKILSYNVCGFNYYSRDREGYERDGILKFVTDQDPDIVCFQEFMSFAAQNVNSEHLVSRALDSLPWNHIYYIHKPSPFLNIGLVTYSRYPVVGKGMIRFKNSKNGGIYTDLQIGADTLRVFNVHLESVSIRKTAYLVSDSSAYTVNGQRIDEAKEISGRMKLSYIRRAVQVDELSRHIEQSPYPVILCGDFNDTPVSYAYQQMKKNLNDSYMGSGKGIVSTYKGKLPSFRIDYIFHSQEFTSREYKVYPIEFSDHYPVTCNLFIRP